MSTEFSRSETREFKHATDRRGDRSVQLWWREGAKWPHAFEMTAERTTNDGGPFASGGLTMDGDMLVDYDGVYELPLAVKAVLKRLGMTFDQFI
jgi:hypothetical protein